MELKVIKTKKEYEDYLEWVDELFDKKVTKNSKEGRDLQVALLLIKTYEDEHYPVPKSSLIHPDTFGICNHFSGEEIVDIG